MQVPSEARDVESLGAGVANRWETLCGCWELSSGPLEEQQVQVTTEPFLQPRGGSPLKGFFDVLRYWELSPGKRHFENAL